MKALETGLQTCKEFNEESTMTSFVDLILTLISEHATLCTRFPLLEYELQFFPSSILICFGYGLTPSAQACAKVESVLERRTMTMNVKVKLRFSCAVDVC